MKKLLINFTIIVSFCFSNKELPVDGLVAVVGKNIVLHTDILQQAQMFAMQQGIDVSQNPTVLEVFYEQALTNMVNQLVLLDAAENDTTIFITPQEIEAALDLQLEDVLLRAGSKKSLEDILKMPYNQIKFEYRKEIKNMLLIDRFRYKLFQTLSISRKEVENFYLTYKDSLPLLESKIKYSFIELPVLPGAQSQKKVLEYVETIKKELSSGASFDEMATLHSQDPGSASLGGDLGYTNKGTLFPEYEDIAFSLNVGEISSPVLTSLGYHLIQLLDVVEDETSGRRIHTRHILRLLLPTEKDKIKRDEEIQQYYLKSKNDPSLFDSLATINKIKYNNESGVYSLKRTTLINNEILNKIQASKEFELISPFYLSSGSACLAYVYNKIEPEKQTLENSWIEIEEYAKNNKINSNFLSWLENKKLKTYIKYFNK